METLPDVAGLLESIERAGGYAALFVLFGVGLFFLANKQITHQAERSAAREAANNKRHEYEMEQERVNAQEHRADKVLALASQEKLATALQELSGVMKGAMSELRETRREVAESRRDIAELRRDIAAHFALAQSDGTREALVTNE